MASNHRAEVAVVAFALAAALFCAAVVTTESEPSDLVVSAAAVTDGTATGKTPLWHYISKSAKEQAAAGNYSIDADLKTAQSAMAKVMKITGYKKSKVSAVSLCKNLDCLVKIAQKQAAIAGKIAGKASVATGDAAEAKHDAMVAIDLAGGVKHLKGKNPVHKCKTMDCLVKQAMKASAKAIKLAKSTGTTTDYVAEAKKQAAIAIKAADSQTQSQPQPAKKPHNWAKIAQQAADLAKKASDSMSKAATSPDYADKAYKAMQAAIKAANDMGLNNVKAPAEATPGSASSGSAAAASA